MIEKSTQQGLFPRRNSFNR